MRMRGGLPIANRTLKGVHGGCSFARSLEGALLNNKMRAVICVSVLLICLSTSGEASVYCYLCHWSKTAESHDTCRSNHFNPSTAKTEMCTTGCQTETFFEGNETTMFSRQCSDKTVHVDECVMVELVGYMRRRNCYCSSNYCNSVSTITSNVLLLLPALYTISSL